MSDFFDGALLTLDVDKDFTEGSDVDFEDAAEHVNNLSIVLNSRVTNDVKVAETIHNLIDITRFHSLKKLIIVTGYVITQLSY